MSAQSRVCLEATLVRMGAAAALLASAALAGCETTGGGFTSPYLNTDDGYFYKYGNFCGPGWPNYPEANTPEQNIAFLESLEPLDDVDRVCRAHDRCYFEFGADNGQCDQMLAELLRDQTNTQLLIASSASFLDNEFNAQCANLAGEILSAVGQFKQVQTYTAIADDESERNRLLGQMGLNAIRNLSAGFPQTPGLCFFNDNQRAASNSPASSALAAAAQLAGGQSVTGVAVSAITSFEPFYPTSEASLAAGRAALMALEARRSSGGGSSGAAQAEP